MLSAFKLEKIRGDSHEAKKREGCTPILVGRKGTKRTESNCIVVMERRDEKKENKKNKRQALI